MKPWDHIDEHELRTLRLSGMTVPDIARELDEPQRWIVARCKDLGIASTFQSAGRGSGGDNDWRNQAQAGTHALLAAIARAHPERISA